MKHTLELHFVSRAMKEKTLSNKASKSNIQCSLNEGLENSTSSNSLSDWSGCLLLDVTASRLAERLLRPFIE